MHTDKDYALALQLQEQYNRINASKNCVTPPNAKVGKNKTPEDKVNLASPTLELRDPTPNAHDLFVNFNRTFFWSKLNSVAVRWSKRMYSCAGICSFNPRSRFCDIALSEPLLKLRPRKDLVETLLHEMIHAYLFVTNNDRDRDGHGPNFLSHMHRINSAANLNISVYHTFHDEVSLYQTHWWRCNGPCQKQKPYFGIVRRSSNRAPGPNDFWWKAHQFNCGGTYIKIKEPEKKQKATASQNNNKAKNNTPKNVRSIKDLFNNSATNKENNFNKTNSSGGVKNGSSSTVLLPNKTVTSKKPTTNNNNNIKTISSLTDNRKSTGSILSFVTPTNKMNQTMTSGITLSEGNKMCSNSDSKSVMETVRNSWLQKFSSNSGGNSGIISNNKRPCDTDIEDVRSSKVIKLENSSDIFNDKVNDVKVEIIPSDLVKSESTNCDIKPSVSSVDKQVKNESNSVNLPSTSKGPDSLDDKNDKLSLFYSIPPKLVEDCNQIMRPLYGDSFTLNEHHFKSSYVNSDLWQKAVDIEDNCKVQCPVCNVMYPRSKIEHHVNHCLECGPSTSSGGFANESIDLTMYEHEFSQPMNGSNKKNTSQTSFVDLTDEDTPTKKFITCLPGCSTDVDNVNVKESPKSSKTQEEKDNNQFIDGDYCNCPLCNKRLNRNDADEHLEQCLSMTFVSEPVIDSPKPDSEKIEDECQRNEELDESEDNSKKACCPCCYKLFDESEINRHLDDCLL